MRLARIVGALVALVLTAVVASSALIAPADAMGKPKHQIIAKGGESSNNHFYLKGKVPTFPKGKIKILRNVSGGPYKTYKQVKTKASGKFRASISEAGHAKTCFKIEVPATSTYKKTTTPVLGCITTS